MEFLFILFPAIGILIGLGIRNSMNAGKSNAPKDYVYSCNQTTLINAFKKAANNIGYDIDKVDTIGGRIRLGVPMSLASFGEWIDIQFTELAENKTKVVISCVAKSGRETISKNRKNIEKLLDAVSHIFAN